MPTETLPHYTAAIQHALARLRAELSPQLTYHNWFHTAEDVLPAARRLAEYSAVPATDIALLEVAAAYHDIGFIYVRAEHERRGVEIVTETLPAYGFTPAHIARISGLIMATRLAQSPKNFLEEILADADLDVLGRDDFYTRNEDLRRELSPPDQLLDQQQWWAGQLKFLQSHTYFTEAARTLRQPAKQHHIAVLEQWTRPAGS